MSSVTLSEAQADVVSFLQNLPNPGAVLIEVNQQVNPTTGRISETIWIKGSSSPTNEPNRCVECGHSEYGTVISAYFEWYRGKFRKAHVWTGTRRQVKSVVAAKKTALYFIALRDGRSRVKAS